MFKDNTIMWKAAHLIVIALVLGQGQSAIDDVFRQVQKKNDDWCRYTMKGSNRKLVKLHYDMVIDQITYKTAFRKDFKHEGVSCEIYNIVGQTANRRGRAASKSEDRRWPLEIPYEIEEGFGAHGNLTIIKAMEQWRRYTCLDFVERTDQYDRIIFSPAEGTCESFVGRIIGPQYISLDPNKCITLPIILHEIGHAIGLYHEHTRADRDEYVTVNYDVINPKYRYNFDKLIGDQYLYFNKTYDYHSIMHYGRNYFASPDRAISLDTTDLAYSHLIGEAQHLSFGDVQIVNAMYKCKEKCANVDCPKGAFVGKNCECFCQGPVKDPVQRCNHPKVFCETPDIDLDIYYVFSEGRKVVLWVLSGTSYPDGTVLIVEDPRCSKHGTGNFTCKNGRWVVNVNCKPDRCVYNTSRYDVTPSITDTSTEYVNPGTIVHVKCVSPNAIPGYDSECTDSLWVPELPNCDAALKCPDVSYIRNGISHQVIWKNPENTYQSVIRYGCDVGYCIVGDASRVCQADDTWSGSMPYCAEFARGVCQADDTWSGCMPQYTTRLSVGIKGLDVIFLIDTSSSFGPASLELAKQFTKMIVNIYGVSASADGGNGTRFALITFDHFANLVFDLDDSTVRSVDAVIKKINEIKSTDGGKCLINALDVARRKIFFPKLYRNVERKVPDTNRAVFILTDSAIDTCPDSIHFSGKLAHTKDAMHFRIFDIWVGRSIVRQSLLDLASERPNESFFMNDLKDLQGIVDILAGRYTENCSSLLAEAFKRNIVQHEGDINKKEAKFKCKEGLKSNIPNLQDVWFTCKYIRNQRRVAWEGQDCLVWKERIRMPPYLDDVICSNACRKPKFPDNMAVISTHTRKLMRYDRNRNITITDDTYFLPGDTISFDCEEGYTQKAIVQQQLDYDQESSQNNHSYGTRETVEVQITRLHYCDRIGIWNNGVVNYGICREITCDAKPYHHIRNGSIKNYRNVYQFQEVMMLECDEGFRPYNNRISIKCLTDDGFKNQNFKCEPITCLTPPDPIHGRLETTKLNYFPNGTAEFSCDYGYTMVGSFAWKCQSSGEWDNSCVQCVRKEEGQWVSGVLNFSSQYNTGSWSAQQILGVPNVYPSYGDLVGTWAPRDIDANQFLEFQFATLVYVTKVDVYETYNAGGVKAIKCLGVSGTWITLWSTPQVSRIQSAMIFSPSFTSTIPCFSNRIRLDIDCTLANTWVEIDAVRLHGSQEEGQWVSGVLNFSSQYNTGLWSAQQILGAPNVYPSYGDLVGTWAPRDIDANQFLEFQFATPVDVAKVDVYETYNAGGVKAIKCLDVSGTWITLWSTPQVSRIQSARIFSPSFTSTIPCFSNRIRLDIDCTLANTYVEIDAVRLHGSQAWSIFDPNTGMYLKEALKNTVTKSNKIKANGSVTSDDTEHVNPRLPIRIHDDVDVDAYILLDISRVIDEHDFETMKAFTMAIMKNLGGSSKTKVSVYLFAKDIKIRLDPKDTLVNEDFIVDAIQSTTLRQSKAVTGQGSDIRRALRNVLFDIETKEFYPRRRIAKQVVILISYENCTQIDDPNPVAEKLKTEHAVEFFSIAIGTKENINLFRVMEKMASKIDGEQHFFAIDEHWGIWKAINNMITQQDVRVELVNGPNNQSGRVEIVIGNIRGTVCDDNWDDNDAKVICRMLGFEVGKALNKSHFGEGSACSILLDEVQCDGTESSIMTCRHSGLGLHDCGHHEDASVICSPKKNYGRRPLEDFSRKKRNLSQRTIGGGIASQGFYPWQAGIRIGKRKKGSRQHSFEQTCGGIILNNRWILSAAHCFPHHRSGDVRVYTGGHDLLNNDTFEEQFEFEQLIKHPNYNSSSHDNDIALIKVKLNNGYGIQFNDEVQPARLPDASMHYETGLTCHISGWGRTSLNSSTGQTVLDAAEVRLIDDEDCKRSYNTQITPNMVCAGYMEGGIDACHRDSGGPLVCRVEGLYYVMGVVFWGEKCALPEYTGVYAKVAAFQFWIETTIALYP